MNFTVLGPNDNPLNDSKSSTVDGNFGGNREHSKTADAKDYTKRTGAAPDLKENPVDETSKDIDEMTDPKSRKREFSRREETSNVQKSNESPATQSDSDHQPDGSDGVIVPEASDLKQQKKANRWQYQSSNRYEGEIS
jgi:hypothetical protein